MSFNNKEYQQWKKDKRRKRTSILACLTAIGIGGGIGIGYGIWNDANSGNQPTPPVPPTPPVVEHKSEDGHNWDHTGSNFSGTVTLSGWTDPEPGEEYGTCYIDSNDAYIAKDLVIPEFVIHDKPGVGDGKIYRITEIRSEAFSGIQPFTPNTNLSGSITISNSVATIGNNVFWSCTNIDELIIGANVKTIGEGAFRYCTGLEGTLKIPNSVTSIEEYAFSNCTNLERLDIGENVKTIGNFAFSTCTGFRGNLEIPDSVTSIGENAFYLCGFTDNLIIGENVVSIGTGAFKGCEGLISDTAGTNNKIFNDGNYVYYIKNDLNYYCLGQSSNVDNTGLKPTDTLQIRNDTKVIGGYAFNQCTLSGGITIPNSVISIGNNAFQGCTGFTSGLSIGTNVKTIGDYAFQGCNFTNTLTIPNLVETIGIHAFSSCSEFTGSLAIGENVKTIGDYAFSLCNFESDLEIPNSVTSIGANAFSSNTSLVGLTIPSSVRAVGQSAFSDCAQLANITIEYGAVLNGVEWGGGYIFVNCNGLVLIQLINFPDTTSSNWNLEAFKGITNAEGGTVSVGGESGIEPADALSFLRSCGLEGDWAAA